MGQEVGMARMKYLQETNMENRTLAWLFGLHKNFLMQQYILNSIHIDIKQITVKYKSIRTNKLITINASWLLITV